MLMLSLPFLFFSFSPVGFRRSSAHRVSNGEIKYIGTTRIRRVRREATKDKARRPLTVKNCCRCLRMRVSLDRIAASEEDVSTVGSCQHQHILSQFSLEGTRISRRLSLAGETIGGRGEATRIVTLSICRLMSQ